MKQAKHSVFARYVTIVNPKSTHAGAGVKRVKKITRLFPESEHYTLQADSGELEAMRKLLRRNAHLLGSKTLLCIVGGDGTINKIIETLLTTEQLKKVRRTPILPLWGGNVNDLAVMLNGLMKSTSLSLVFKHGKIVPVYPLECVISLNGNSKSYIATNYISFGASAHVARRLNEATYRESRLHNFPGGRLLKEMLVTIKTFLESPIFSVKEAGSLQPIYERVYANGSRIARVNYLPIKLTDKGFFQVRVERRHACLFFRRLFDLFYQRDLQFRQKKPNTFTVYTHGMMAQFDGESIDIPKGATVRVRLARLPFYALATKL